MIIAAATALVFISFFAQGHHVAIQQKTALVTCDSQSNMVTVSPFNMTCRRAQVNL